MFVAPPNVGFTGRACRFGKLQKRKEATLRQTQFCLDGKLAESVIPSGWENTGLHCGMNGGCAFFQRDGDGLISTQGYNKIACVVTHAAWRNAKILDRQVSKSSDAKCLASSA